MTIPQYAFFYDDWAGKNIDDDRRYEEVKRMADDGSWFEMTDGDVVHVDEADRADILNWYARDLLIVDRSCGDRPSSYRVTHVVSKKNVMVG